MISCTTCLAVSTWPTGRLPGGGARTNARRPKSPFPLASVGSPPPSSLARPSLWSNVGSTHSMGMDRSTPPSRAIPSDAAPSLVNEDLKAPPRKSHSSRIRLLTREIKTLTPRHEFIGPRPPFIDHRHSTPLIYSTSPPVYAIPSLRLTRTLRPITPGQDPPNDPLTQMPPHPLRTLPLRPSPHTDLSKQVLCFHRRRPMCPRTPFVCRPSQALLFFFGLRAPSWGFTGAALPSGLHGRNINVYFSFCLFNFCKNVFPLTEVRSSVFSYYCIFEISPHFFSSKSRKRSGLTVQIGVATNLGDNCRKKNR